MSNKLALVVDDSRMARHVLSKMLTEQGIDVDSVESGEEALGYLCGKKPSMIFMDHTMPGMDGFQCLRAIKNDPHTAAIPIIMYTSKEGEVYESQARALGAVDVLPKTLKPLLLAQVLERQNLLPHQAASIRPGTPQVGQAANDVVIVDNDPKPEPTKSTRPADKPEEHPELEALENRIEQLTKQLQGMSQQDSTNRSRAGIFQYVGLALCVALIGWLLLNNNRLMQEITVMQSSNQQLEDTVRLQTQTNDAMRNELNTQLDAQVQMNDNQNRQFYESIEWALNEDGQFDWNEKPFNDRLAMTLSQLAQNLSSVGFSGEIAVRSHLGRFCLVTATNGEPVLPESDALLSNCDILQLTPTLAESVGTDQTPGFERFVAAFQAEYGDDIELSLSTAGDRRPVARYPGEDPDASAERWNKIAARNQRIEISINPY